VSPECKAELASVERAVKDVGEACRDDIASYCPGVQPGQGAILRCLRENQTMLTPGCQGILKGAREKEAEFRKSCGKDAQKLCKGINPGYGRILACLKSKQAELSPACSSLMGN